MKTVIVTMSAKGYVKTVAVDAIGIRRGLAAAEEAKKVAGEKEAMLLKAEEDVKAALEVLA